MSRTFKRQVSRESSLKREDKYSGYEGESCYAQEGRAFIKKLIHKHNRRIGKKQLQKEFDNG